MSNFWAGPDFSVASSISVSPGQKVFVPVKIEPNHFPLDKSISISNYDLQVSTRSCFAQAGVSIERHILDDDGLRSLYFGKGREFALGIKQTVEKFLFERGECLYNFCIENNGKAYVTIQDGVKLGRFFHFPYPIHGKKVENPLSFIESGDLVIDGEYGEEYWLVDQLGNILSKEQIKQIEDGVLFVEQQNDITGEVYKELVSFGCVRLQVKINQKKLWLPKTLTDTIIMTKKDTEKILFPTNQEEIKSTGGFFISETPFMKLSNNIALKLELFDLDGYGKHISSPLIDPGFEGPIRTEIYCTTNKFPQMVEFDICRVQY